jgi:uncharacterized protein (DUF934 family)
MSNTIHFIAGCAIKHSATALKPLQVANDTDVDTLRDALASAAVVELQFPKFTDGRAYSQAVQLRRRLGFKGEIRATGDVLIDQLVQMQRTGFSSAVLRDDQDAAHGQKLLAQYAGFYQGDDQLSDESGATLSLPRFAAVAHGVA